MSDQVFISYAHKDAAFVRMLQKELSGDFVVWVDEEYLQGGVDWRSSIDEAISLSFALVVVLTPDSVESKYVTYEWSYALGLGIPVIPIMLQETYRDSTGNMKQIGVHPRIADIQYHNFQSRFEEPWDDLKRGLMKIKEEYRERGEKTAEVAWKFIEQGRNLREKNDLRNALQAYKQSIHYANNSLLDDIFYEMGCVYLDLKNVAKEPEDAQKFEAQAEEELRRALAYNEDHIQALVQIGHIFRKRADKAGKAGDENERERLLLEAQLRFRKALNLQNNLLDEEGESVWGSLGGVYQRLNQTDKAIEAYLEAARVKKSSYPYGNLGLLYMERGDVENMQRNFALVELFARSKINIKDPGDEWAHNDLLVALLVRGKLMEARDAFSNVLVLSNKGSLSSVLGTVKRLQAKNLDLKDEILEFMQEIVEIGEQELLKKD